MSEDENPYIVKPVAKALGVLSHVASLGHETTLTAVMKDVGLPRTTCFRYLQTLAEAGYLFYDRSTDRYGLGSRFRGIVQADQDLHSLRLIARSQMLLLEQEYEETINLGILAGAEVVYVEIVEARRSLRIQGRIGDRHPAHSTALGKAILSHLSDDEVRVRLNNRLDIRTSRTMTKIDEIISSLQRFKRQGFATEFEENEESAVCVASAILNSEEQPVAAISLSAPKQRLSRGDAIEVGLRLRIATKAITAQITGAG
ncbi:MAG: IclR family transcriptional regulator [Rhizobiaceae bacterium]|nr:IclR family transcriptional regulator [Rhizobiaceae bacterium]